MNTREFDTEHIVIAPPTAGVCPICASNHGEAMPHNRNSLYYQMRFWQKHGRFPTWADAMAHCDEHTKAVWVGLLAECRVKVDDVSDIWTWPEGMDHAPKSVDSIFGGGTE